MAKKVYGNRPKRVASAYIRFTSDERKREGGQEKASVAEQAGRYSKRWASLSDEEKKKYTDAYQEDMVEYRKAVELYKETDEYKEFLLRKDDDKKKASSRVSKTKKPRNVSPYNIFMAEVYEKKKQEGSFDFREVASLASEQWKKMTKQNKEAYQKKADEKNKARREKAEAMA